MPYGHARNRLQCHTAAQDAGVRMEGLLILIWWNIALRVNLHQTDSNPYRNPLIVSILTHQKSRNRAHLFIFEDDEVMIKMKGPQPIKT